MKKNRVLKWLSVIVLAVVMIVAALPAGVSADPVFQDPYGHTVEWWNFRNSQDNNAVTDRPTPTSDKEAWGKWAVKFGTGYAAAPTPPIIVDGKLYIGVGNTVLELDKETGQMIRASETMPGKVGYAMHSPVYADGKIFVAITDGRICAVNISDLSVAWTTDNTNIVRGQTVSPINYVKIDGTGYISTGTWDKVSGTLFCATTDDENVELVTDAAGNVTKVKHLAWSFDPSVVDAKNLAANNCVATGYYWTGAYVTENYLAIGSDNGSATGEEISDTAFYTLNPTTGKIIDAVYGIKGQVRSTTVYKDGCLYFSTKDAKIYKIPVDETGHLGAPSYIDMTEYGALMATATPVVYGGKIYLGVQGKGNQFSADGGHGFLVARDDKVLSNASFLYNLSVPGYPQAGALLSSYHEDEDYDGDGIADGRVYLFFTYNARPGGIYYTFDTPGQTEPTLLSTEESRIFVPEKDKQEFCISSIIVDEDGTLYYKNDSSYLFAVESNPAAIENLQVFDEQGNEFALNQPFMTKMAQYSTTVSSKTEKVKIVLNLCEGVSATVNGTAYKSGGIMVNLNEDITEITVVSNKSGKSRTYNLTVSKASANADLAALGSAKGNTAPSQWNNNTRTLVPEFDKDVTEYSVDWITTGTGDSSDPATTNMMNLFLKPESGKATVTVWPLKNTLNTGTNADGSAKQYSASGGFKYRYPIYSADILRDSTARIVVTAEDGQTQKEYHVLFSRRVYVADISLNRNSLELFESEEFQLEASILPENATDPTVTWTSSDERVAEVDNTGKVTALAEGNTTITASAEDGTVTAECDVTVIKGESAALLQVTGQDQKNTLLKKDGRPLVLEETEVSATAAKLAGYTKPEAYKTKVTALDALIELHKAYYGDAFLADPQAYLKISEAGTVTKVFGEETTEFMFHVNDAFPCYEDNPGKGSMINDTVLKDGDSVRFFRVFGKLSGKDDSYLTFDQKSYEVHQGDALSVSVKAKYAAAGMSDFGPWEWSPAKGAVCVITDAEGKEVARTEVNEEGVAAFEMFDFSEMPEGKYDLVVSSYKDDQYESDAFAVPYAKLCTTAHNLYEVAAAEASCEQDGRKAYYICKDCNRLYTDATGKTEIEDPKSLTIPGGHVWDEGVTEFKQECGGVEVTVYTCRNNPSHTRIAATGTEGHTWETEYTVDQPATCECAGSESLHCSVCGAINPDSIRTIEHAGHQYGEWETVTEAGCEEHGMQRRVCANNETHSEIRFTAPAGHKPAEAVRESEAPATCVKAGSYEEVVYCSVCEKELSRTVKKIPAPGHMWSEEYTVEKAATCTEEGSESIHCTVCDAKKKGSERSIAMTPHTFGEWVVTKEPTFDAPGTQKHTCSECGATETQEIPKLERIDISSADVSGIIDKEYTGKAITQSPVVKLGGKTLATGTDYTVSYRNNVSVGTATVTITGTGNYCGSVSRQFKIKAAAAVPVKSIKLSRTSMELATKRKAQLKVTFNPANATNQGLTWSSGNPEVASVDKNGVVSALARGTATITATSNADKSKKATCELTIKYCDAFYDLDGTGEFNITKEMETAINWAADKKITGEKVEFGTNNSMTRGQFVRFLYRYAGQPKVTNSMIKKYGSQFKDVNKKYTHFKAIVWAVSKGLIAGYSDGTFKPNGTLTRNNVATILWKYAGSPKVKNAKKPFSDVAKSAAIAWGKNKKIFTGTKFQPKSNCVRGDFALFLYRYDKMK